MSEVTDNEVKTGSWRASGTRTQEQEAATREESSNGMLDSGTRVTRRWAPRCLSVGPGNCSLGNKVGPGDSVPPVIRLQWFFGTPLCRWG